MAVLTNSKNIKKGDTFVALGKGTNFIDEALQKGADKIIKGEVQFGKAAKKYLQSLRKQNPQLQVIGITGSFGKTTVKDLLGFILSKAGQTVFAKESYNNEIGVPITIFAADEKTEYLVLEMGANKIGDIKYLTDIAPLDVACLLGVGSAHISSFGNLDNIVSAKGEIFAGLKNGGVGFVPDFDKNAKNLIKIYNHKNIKTFSRFPSRSQSPSFISTNLLGEHNLSNISAVISICEFLKIDTQIVRNAIEQFKPISKHRLQLLEKPPITFLDDSYNANPASMLSGLKTLLNLKKTYPKKYLRALAVLGKMEELGKESKNEHLEVGKAFQNSAVEKILVFGEKKLYGTSDKFLYFSSKLQIADYIKKNAKKGDILLVKASNYSKLWEIVEGV
ncbi:MAG: UDP-N-acetylmuramoyl-tripeptide--D-alanyl-D-alanine ligase [Bifidobacteriaceae bacterium]|jgi:UDP-N-acetylmuramoyl-tripeptide--D-alanyl-D-alanine ligase|nr:UDP-N-acetylmuramoyl-tripeptide--D-alanyl-D-alanine ligase [Bifidobacteriaceae bacterium]